MPLEKMKMKIQRNVPLAPLTTIKIGGKARFFIAVDDHTEVADAINFADAEGLDLFVLGGGSNVLIADEGFDGLVVHLRMRGVSVIAKDGEKVFLRAAAGVDWDAFVAFCVERNLAGIECLSGIPGKVGATPIQNVGAYGQEVSETIVKVTAFDKQEKKVVELKNDECGFGYRSSIFNSIYRNRFIILDVVFRLVENGSPKISYKDLIEFFDGGKPDLKKTREAVIEIRRRKAMVIDERDPNSRGCGSFFKNPIVTADKLEELKRIFARDSEAMIPAFPMENGKFKISAAWLIEKAGFQKGYRMGNVGISEKHSLAIVNLSDASASEVIRLKNLIQIKVREKFGIDLMPEPVFIGFKDSLSI